MTTALPTLLSEASKQKISLIMSNQFLDQLKGPTLEAAMGNVWTKVVFQCGSKDAETISGYVKPQFTHQDIVKLDRFQAAVVMQKDGMQQPAFSLATRPAPSKEQVSLVQSYSTNFD